MIAWCQTLGVVNGWRPLARTHWTAREGQGGKGERYRAHLIYGTQGEFKGLRAFDLHDSEFAGILQLGIETDDRGEQSIELCIFILEMLA